MTLALVILGLVKVQANDSSPTTISYLFKTEDRYQTFSSCLEKKFEICKAIARRKGMTIEVSCIINIITSCKKMEDPHDPMRQKAIEAELLCIQKHQRHIYIYWVTLVRDCLLEWYEKN